MAQRTLPYASISGGIVTPFLNRTVRTAPRAGVQTHHARVVEQCISLNCKASSLTRDGGPLPRNGASGTDDACEAHSDS